MSESALPNAAPLRSASTPRDGDRVPARGTSREATLVAQPRLDGLGARHRDRGRDPGRLGRPDRVRIDSAIEGFASVIIIWRFTGARACSRPRPSSGPRGCCGPVLHSGSLRRLRGDQPFARRRASGDQRPRHGADRLERGRDAAPRPGQAERGPAPRVAGDAWRGDAELLCAYLAAAVFLGLAGNALFGAWWLDPIAALFIAAVAVREGIETWRGEWAVAPRGLP